MKHGLQSLLRNITLSAADVIGSGSLSFSESAPLVDRSLSLSLLLCCECRATHTDSPKEFRSRFTFRPRPWKNSKSSPLFFFFYLSISLFSLAMHEASGVRTHTHTHRRTNSSFSSCRRYSLTRTWISLGCFSAISTSHEWSEKFALALTFSTYIFCVLQPNFPHTRHRREEFACGWQSVSRTDKHPASIDAKCKYHPVRRWINSKGRESENAHRS